MGSVVPSEFVTIKRQSESVLVFDADALIGNDGDLPRGAAFKRLALFDVRFQISDVPAGSGPGTCPSGKTKPSRLHKSGRFRALLPPNSPVYFRCN